MPMTITGGQSEGMSGGTWTAPKKDLKAGLMVLLEGRELKIAKGMEWSGVLLEELAGMRVKEREGGGESMEGEKDALVMALSLACRAGRKEHGRKLTGRVGGCVRTDGPDRCAAQ